MSGFKNINKTSEPVMTTQNVMDAEVRVVSQASQDNIDDSTTDAMASTFLSTATPEEAAAVIAAQDENSIPDDFMHESIIALPKIASTQLDIMCKDPAYSFRWVNYKSNEGSSYFNHQTWGFVNARPEDIKGTFDTQAIKDQDGALVFGDLLLMKIPKLKLFGYYKRNVLEAQRNVSRQRIEQRGFEEATKQFSKDVQGAPAGYVQERAKFYVPSNIPGEL